MTTKEITNLLTGSNMKAGLKADFAKELLNKATETADYENISLDEAFKKNFEHYVNVAQYDAKRTNWANGFNQLCRGVAFDMPYMNFEIEETYNLSPDSYWYSLGRGLETIAKKLNLI